MANTSKWRNDRIKATVDEETGLRVVELPTVKGLTKAQRDSLFAFEREQIGTVKAVIRMNKRAAGVNPNERADGTVALPYRLARALESADASIKALYA